MSKSHGRLLNHMIPETIVNLSNLSVKARLFATLAFLSALTVTVGVLGDRMAGQVAADMQYSYDNYFTAEAMLGEIVSRQRGNTEQMLLGTMARNAGGGQRRSRASRTESRPDQRAVDRYEKTIVTPEERQLADAFHAAQDAADCSQH